MADMLVDSTKLDACLDAEADAIRAKTGVSADIPFDYANNKGFADAIAAIPTGGGSGAISLLDSGTFTVATATNQITIPVSVNGTIKYAYVEKDEQTPSVGQVLRWCVIPLDPNATDIYQWLNPLSYAYFVAANGTSYGSDRNSATPGGAIASITDSGILLKQYSNNYQIRDGSYTWKVWGVAT